MINLSKIKAALASSLVLFALAILLPARAAAAGATLYLSPGSKSVAQGSTLTISVRVSPNGNAVNAVQANLSYPASKFDFISTSCGGSFTVKAQASGGNGAVQLACGLIGTVTTDSLVGTVNLRAKTSSGTAAVTFAGGSNVASNGGNVTGATNGANYTFTTPPVQAPKDTTPPQISAVTVSGISYHAANISWKTDEASTSVVEYGVTTNLGLTAQTAGTTTTHSVDIPANTLVPGVQYYYRVTSVDAAGNAAHSNQATFTTTGITVEIMVQSNKSVPIKGAQVVFLVEGIKATTDQNGIAVFNNIIPNKYAIAVTYNGIQKSGVIEVKDSSDPQTFSTASATNYGDQKFTVRYGAALATHPLSWPTVLITLGSVGLIGGAVTFGYRLYRRRGYTTFTKTPLPAAAPPPPTPAPNSPVIQDVAENRYKSF